jgi:carbamoyltransferase
VASAFQRHLGSLLVSAAADVKRATGATRLCVGGGLFYNTTFNTVLRQSGMFDDVFVPPNVGNAGIAIGAALTMAEQDGQAVQGATSPFLGPEYDAETIKQTLDNCKLSYECLSDRDTIETAASALARGQLVGWFQGRMEWGPRALGNRSILASPHSPYVLDNLNVFLKHRERHRLYGLSVPEEQAANLFDGPPQSRFMEFEYQPRNRGLFRTVMLDDTTTLRVQTVPDKPGDPETTRLRGLHERVGQTTGLPVLVHTSFNGFAEPMVCSPRDAIRVFFGTGLDLLVMQRFVVRK